jgi:hypothetical protein
MPAAWANERHPAANPEKIEVEQIRPDSLHLFTEFYSKRPVFQVGTAENLLGINA